MDDRKHGGRDRDEAGRGLPPASGAAGTTDQKPRWEGPPENRSRGYLPAEDDPSREPDANGETLADPDKDGLGDALKQRGDGN